jgi:transposase
MEGSRRSRFETIDRPALRPLPERPYEYALYTTARVGFDCHVGYEHNFYSAPHALVHKEVDLRVTDKVVEILFHGQRVASHVRVFGKGIYQTDVNHLPEAHRRHLEWTPERLIRWGAETGPMLGRLIEEILKERPHPEQGYRSCLGIMRLGKTYSPERLEAAATRALSIGTKSYRSVKSILDSGLDKQPLPTEADKDSVLPQHDNLRGPDYYSTEEAETCLFR